MSYSSFVEEKNRLRKFGITMGIAFLVIAVLILLKHRHSPRLFFALSAVFFAAGFIFPLALKPVYSIWMRIGFILGWINTRLILAVIFYLVFAPVGLFMRIFRIDLLDRKLEKNKMSYWRKKDDIVSGKASYERQF